MFGELQALITLVLFFGFLLIKIWAVADCATRPAGAFVAANRRTRMFWLLLTGISALTAFVTSPIGIFGLAGLIVALVYLLDVRPRVREITGSRY